MQNRSVCMNKLGYCYIRLNNKKCNIHRLVMHARPRQIVDHINGETFDNRKENLRFTSQSFNIINRKGVIKHSSEFGNVSYVRYTSWRAYLSKSGKYLFKQYFRNEVIAALFVDYILKKYIPICGYLNFPIQIKRDKLRDYVIDHLPERITIWFVKKSDSSIHKLTGRIDSLSIPDNLNKKHFRITLFCENQYYKTICSERILCLICGKDRIAVIK